MDLQIYHRLIPKIQVLPPFQHKPLLFAASPPDSLTSPATRVNPLSLPKASTCKLAPQIWGFPRCVITPPPPMVYESARRSHGGGGRGGENLKSLKTNIIIQTWHHAGRHPQTAVQLWSFLEAVKYENSIQSSVQSDSDDAPSPYLLN